MKRLALFALVGALTLYALAPSNPAAGRGAERQPIPSKNGTLAAPDQRGTEHMPLVIRGIPEKTPEEKAADKEAERKEKAEKYILDKALVDETKHLADETKWLTTYTLGLAIVTGALFILAFFQMGDAKKAARAAERSAEIAAQSVDVQLRIEKPFLHVNGHAIITNPAFADHIVVPIRNSGKTDAVILEYVIDCTVGLDRLPPKPIYGRQNTTLDGHLLAIGDTVQLINIFPDGGHLTPVFRATAPAVLWGNIRYEDVFGRVWTRGFGFRFSFVLTIDDEIAEGQEPQLVWIRDGGPAYNYDREDDFQQQQNQQLGCVAQARLKLAKFIAPFPIRSFGD